MAALAVATGLARGAVAAEELTMACAPEPLAGSPAASLVAPWTVLLSAERLFVFSPFAQDGPLDELSPEVLDSGLSFGAVGFAASTDELSARPFFAHAMPRLGADLVMPAGISVGLFGGLGRSLGARDQDDADPYSTGGLAAETPTADTYVAGGRVGAVYAADVDVVLWGRVGLAHGWAHHDRPSDWGYLVVDTGRLTALQLEAEMLFVPVEHFALSLTLGADIALRGSTGQEVISQTPAPAERVRRDADAFYLWLGLLSWL